MCRLFKTSVLFIALLLCQCKCLLAQDTHFSQFDAAPLYFNPALSGVDECKNRIYGNYKGQWNTYNTILLSYDQHLERVQLFGGAFGLGGLIVADYAGTNAYGNTQVKLMPSYHYNVVPGVFRLSVGLEMLMNIMSINEEKIVTATNIDPITGQYIMGTNLESTNRFYADMGLGLNSQINVQPQIPINVGVTFFRLFGSGGGGLAVQSSEIQENYRRFSLNASGYIPFTSTVALMPSFIYINQKMYNEMNFGTYVKFGVGEYTKIIDALYVGSWYRVKDAVIIGLAFDRPLVKNWTLQLGLSYDITVSSFRQSNKWTSGKNVKGDSFEISVKLLNCQKPINVRPEGIVNDPFR